MIFNRRFVALEGVDGAGKTTTLALLNRMGEGGRFHLCHDPAHDSPLGKFVSNLWKDSDGQNDEAFHLLFAASSLDGQHNRTQAMSSSAPKLAISDRSAYSTFAYLPNVTTDRFLLVHTQYEFPILTVYFEIDLALALRRLQRRALHGRDIERLERMFSTITARYRQILAYSQHRGASLVSVRIMEGSSEEEVARQVESEVAKFATDACADWRSRGCE